MTLHDMTWHYIHTYVRTYIHTYIHIYIYIHRNLVKLIEDYLHPNSSQLSQGSWMIRQDFLLSRISLWKSGHGKPPENHEKSLVRPIDMDFPWIFQLRPPDYLKKKLANAPRLYGPFSKKLGSPGDFQTAQVSHHLEFLDTTNLPDGDIPTAKKLSHWPKKAALPKLMVFVGVIFQATLGVRWCQM